MELEVGHIGPPMEEGPLPSVFYFALSAQESLELDPYNQPALYLSERGIRVFSVNLPAHGPNLSPHAAIQAWASDFADGKDPLSPFLSNVIDTTERLEDRGLIEKERMGFMGLSRGGLIALHIASRLPATCPVACFAPMTGLTFAKEFAPLKDNPLLASYDVQKLAQALHNKPVRIYMGNRDTRVGTKLAFECVEIFANTAFENGVRSPPAELILTPSIGHMGHGTSKESFEAGAHWLGKQLGAIR